MRSNYRRYVATLRVESEIDNDAVERMLESDKAPTIHDIFSIMKEDYVLILQTVFGQKYALFECRTEYQTPTVYVGKALQDKPVRLKSISTECLIYTNDPLEIFEFSNQKNLPIEIRKEYAIWLKRNLKITLLKEPERFVCHDRHYYAPLPENKVVVIGADAYALNECIYCGERTISKLKVI